MIGRFRKMHGLGNDFVVIDARANALEMTSARARAIAARHLGIDCDQLILIRPSDEADVHMRIFNAAAREVDACCHRTRHFPALLGGYSSSRTKAGISHHPTTGESHP